MVGADITDELLDLHPLEQLPLLMNIPDPSKIGRRQPFGFHAKRDALPGVWQIQPDHVPQQRTLAAAVSPQQTDDPPRHDIDTDTIERLRLPKPL